VHNIVSYLVDGYGNRNGAVAVNVRVDDFQLDLDTAVACGMIINELASNALKHAFPADWPGEEGLIRVELCVQDNGDRIVIVSDDGIGLDPALDPQDSQSLGLRLARMLTGQLGGVMDLERRGGTAFRISFPASSHS
jgi:two-component sensor histidine kinase